MKVTTILMFTGAAFAYALPQATEEAAKTNGTAAAGNTACSKTKQQELIGGIQSNLDVQKKELTGVQTLQRLATAATNGTGLKAPTNGTSDFQITQLSVLNTQMQGINIRATNQILAGQIKSPALNGLNTLATAQVAEMGQVTQLKGTGAKDEELLKSIVKEVEDGTKQNEENLKAAESQKCTEN